MAPGFLGNAAIGTLYNVKAIDRDPHSSAMGLCRHAIFRGVGAHWTPR